jgi:hypothetical protein
MFLVYELEYCGNRTFAFSKLNQWTVHYNYSCRLSLNRSINCCFYPRLYSYNVSVLTRGKRAKWRVVALSSCRPVASEARQTARCRAAHCRPVALLIYKKNRQSFDLSRATTWHRNNTSHDNKTKVRQRAVWSLFVLSLATTRCTKAFQISHHR